MSEEMKKGLDAFPYVNENCIYCGLCARNCPVSAITVNRAEKHWEVNKSACILCGTCESKCPKQAITLKKGLPLHENLLHCQFPYREAKVFCW